MSSSLRQYNTFGIDAQCNSLLHIYNEQQLFAFLSQNKDQYMIIGGGSNILFKNNYAGTILINQIKGIEIIDEDENSALVRVGSGENWHQFVQWAVVNNLGGLENLSLIPGTVGAAPIQNIGAYGVEQNQCFHSLQCIDVMEGITKTMYNEDCKFGYRDSIFKHGLKEKVIITKVCYLLNKKSTPHVKYADVLKYLEEKKIGQPCIADISNAVINIRTAKLPDPKVIGNAGSFFKNPVISKVQFENIIKTYPEIAHYPTAENVKLAAAWLIDQCGFKGKVYGNTGSYKNQALVIVNHGNATGQEIYDYACLIQKSVMEKFDVHLEMEVNIV